MRPGPPSAVSLGQVGDGGFAGFDEGGFADQVFGGVAADGELGGYDQVGALCGGFGAGAADAGDVDGDLAQVGVDLGQGDAEVRHGGNLGCAGWESTRGWVPGTDAG